MKTKHCPICNATDLGKPVNYGGGPLTAGLRHCPHCRLNIKPNVIEAETITTTWDLRTYDVWGNAKEGFEVNDCWSAGSVELELEVKVYNQGKPGEFKSADPSDAQIRKAFGLTNIQIETEGDDLCIYVSRASNGYPLGEMRCTSHQSLSPIRAIGEDIENTVKRLTEGM